MIANKRETVGFFKLYISLLRDACKYIANICFGSRATKSLRDSELAAIRRFPAAQTKILDFPD
jgi:hypothetical protein